MREVKSVLFAELSDAQPISKMEMPRALQLEHPNGTTALADEVIHAEAGRCDSPGRLPGNEEGQLCEWEARALVAFGIILAAAQDPC